MTNNELVDIPLYRQYAKANNLSKFINLLWENYFLDEKSFIDEYINLYTCNSVGLNFWGEFLQQPKTIYAPYYNNQLGFNGIATPIQPTRHVNPETGVIDIEYQTWGFGTWYNGALSPQSFTESEYRIVLLNAYNLQYLACTLKNLIDYLNGFFKVLPNDPSINPNYNMQWQVIIESRGGNLEKWTIRHSNAFIDLIPFEQNWNLLFNKYTDTGANAILPIPNMVQWSIKQGLI